MGALHAPRKRKDYHSSLWHTRIESRSCIMSYHKVQMMMDSRSKDTTQARQPVPDKDISHFAWWAQMYMDVYKESCRNTPQISFRRQHYRDVFTFPNLIDFDTVFLSKDLNFSVVKIHIFFIIVIFYLFQFQFLFARNCLHGLNKKARLYIISYCYFVI